MVFKQYVQRFNIDQYDHQSVQKKVTFLDTKVGGRRFKIEPLPDDIVVEQAENDTLEFHFRYNAVEVENKVDPYEFEDQASLKLRINRSPSLDTPNFPILEFSVT